MKKSLKSLLNLTAFELDRLSKFLYVLIGLTFLSNLISYIVTPMRYISRMNEYMSTQSASSQQALEYYNRFSFYNAIDTVWIAGPIAIGISGFLFYAVFIWYREWMGKNTFAYRLLMLPVPRMHLYFSKLIVIYLGIFSLITTQIVSLFIGFQIVSAIVPGEWFANVNALQAIQMNPLFIYIIPVEPMYFLGVNGIGLVFIIVLFTLILMERSYSIKGIFMGIVYGAAALAISLFPMLISDIFQNQYILYDSEIILILTFILTLIAITSILVSRHLLTKKITI
ncbi:MAG: hypothetical protein JJU16_00665 [Alkalibacterium sp.]|nr:hypothetical protein [Alkalibacterium sp.]